MTIDSNPSTPNRNESDKPLLGFGGVTNEGYIHQHWTWTIDENGDPAPDKYVGPGPLINPETGEAIKRERPGSPYVELDFKSEERAKALSDYTVSLMERAEHNQERYSYGAPEIYPLQEDIEFYMLRRFIDQDGKINIWDTSLEVQEYNNGAVPYFLGRAYASFISGLNLEVKTLEGSVPEKVAGKVSRRWFVLGSAATALAAGLTVANYDARSTTEKSETQPDPIRYSVTHQNTDGIWGIVHEVYGLDEDGIREYMDTADIVILDEHGTEVDGDMNHIEAGYTVLLPQP